MPARTSAKSKEFFALDPAEKRSSLWIRLVEHMGMLIEDYRTHLENGSDDDERHRGAIEALRQLMDLGKDRNG